MIKNFAALLVALVWAHPGVVGAQSGVGGDALLVWAPAGSSEADLGRLYDAHFNPVRGAAFTGDPVDARAADTYRSIVRVASRIELEARARFGGVGGSVQLGHTETLGYIRAISLRRIVRVAPRAEVTPVPGAAYFVSEIQFGYAYELQAIGQESQVGGAIETIGAGGSASRSTSSVRIQGGTRGLVPEGSEIEAMAASTPQQILQRFRTDGDQPHALFFKLERLPVSSELVAEGTAPALAAANPSGSARRAPARYEVHAVSMQFPPRNVLRNNFAWDVMGGLPDMRVEVFQGGQLLARFSAPRNRTSHTYREAVSMGRPVTVSPEQPLEFRFYDVDASSHDRAGSNTVTALHDGDMRITVPETGAQLVIRVRTLTN